MSDCHCGRDGHPLHSINCPVHGSDAQLDAAVKTAARCFDPDRCMRDQVPFGDIAPRYLNYLRMAERKPSGCDGCIEQSREMILEAFEAARKVRA